MVLLIVLIILLLANAGLGSGIPAYGGGSYYHFSWFAVFLFIVILYVLGVR